MPVLIEPPKLCDIREMTNELKKHFNIYEETAVSNEKIFSLNKAKQWIRTYSFLRP